jgi:hypothetical protein
MISIRRCRSFRLSPQLYSPNSDFELVIIYVLIVILACMVNSSFVFLVVLDLQTYLLIFANIFLSLGTATTFHLRLWENFSEL